MLSSRTFWKKILYVIGALRIASVFLIFKYPLYAIIISLILDDLDAGVAYKAGISWTKYTRYDKLLDYWWYIFVLIFCRSEPIFGVMLVLFVLRSVGQILVILTAKHEYLFWFPNIFEHYFILYILVKVFFPSYLHFFVGVGVFVPLLIATATKIPQEYILHRKGWFYSAKTWAKSVTQVFGS